MPRAVVEIDFFAMENARSYSAVDHQSASGSGCARFPLSLWFPLVDRLIGGMRVVPRSDLRLNLFFFFGFH